MIIGTYWRIDCEVAPGQWRDCGEDFRSKDHARLAAAQLRAAHPEHRYKLRIVRPKVPPRAKHEPPWGGPKKLPRRRRPAP